jgi:hypothetical protein
MTIIPPDAVQAYQARTYRLLPGTRLTSPDQAVEYVNERGFIFFWPITGITLPSLWSAVAGDRPVADAHDDPGHVSWSWKDSLLGSRRWYYAKVLRKKATIIANWLVPHFYALSENYGSPEEDYLTLYEQGRLTQEAKALYEVLLDEGPQDTVALRRRVRMTSRESDSRFNKAITDLQTGFKIMPTGVARVGGWNYAFIYDIVPRHLPDLPEQAHHIRETTARQTLAETYLRSVGAAQMRDLTRLFGWTAKEAEAALTGVDTVITQMEIEGKPGPWAVWKEIVTES